MLINNNKNLKLTEQKTELTQELTNEQIIALHETQELITSNFKKNADYGFNLDIDSFFLRVKGLSSQRYGLRAQAYFSTLLDYRTLKSSDDCGDFLNHENEEIEFKCSFLSKTSTDINIRQVRLWQELKYYYIFTVDYTDYRDLKYKCYKLSKEQMEKEIITLNATQSHMTKEKTLENKYVEFGFSIKVGSKVFTRFEDKYLLKNFDIKLLSQKRIEKLNSDKLMLDKIKEQEDRILELENKLKAIQNKTVFNSFIEKVESILCDDEELKDKYNNVAVKIMCVLYSDTVNYNLTKNILTEDFINKYHNKKRLDVFNAFTSLIKDLKLKETFNCFKEKYCNEYVNINL